MLKRLTKPRKGFTLVEMIICALILAIVVICVASISGTLSTLKTETRNSIFLSMHNLNTSERLRQMVYELPEGEQLNAFYGAPTGTGAGGVIDPSDIFSTDEILTRVFVTAGSMDHFQVYVVRIESQMRGYKQRLVSSYTLTNIGGHAPGGSLEDPVESSPVLEG